MATTVTLKPNAIDISGSTSGTTTLQATAVAGTTTLTLPAATDTLVGKATTDTLTNKTLTTPSVSSPTISDGTANGVAYLNGSKVLTTGSALVFDGTNLGVGVTPAAWSSFSAFEIGSRGNSVSSYSAGGIYVGSNNYFNGTNWIYKISGAGTAPAQYYAADGIHVWQNAAAGTAGNTITFSERMRLDASGNLGLGVTPPTQNGGTGMWYTKGAILSDGNSFYPGIRNAYYNSGWKYTTTGYAQYYVQDDVGKHIWYNAASGTAGNAITFTQAMTIDASGNLLVGDTSAYSGSRLSVKTGNNNGTTHAWYAKNSSATLLGYQRDDGLFNTGAATNSPYNFTTAAAANLFVDASGTFYRSTSSLKYKTNVQNATHGLADLLKLRSVTYKGKNDGDKVYGGLIAEEIHEAGLTEFVQYAEDGTPDALNYGNMVSLCIKAIQEQQTLITQLQADVAALKGA